MKMVTAFAALALTGAVAPPKISLSLEGMTSSYRLDKPIYRQEGTKMSRQDWTEKCPALRFCPEASVSPDGSASKCETDPSAWVYTSEANCPFPRAAAYDHQDKNVDVTTRIFLIDTDGDGVQKQLAAGASIDFKKRSTYLFKYDAVDQHGNDAEQVVFALILDDANKPFWNKDCANPTTSYQKSGWTDAIQVEAVSDWKLCDARAFDNYDSVGASDVEYKVIYQGLVADKFTNVVNGDYTAQTAYRQSAEQLKFGTYAQALAQFKSGPGGVGPENVGKFIVITKVSDNAGVYGHNAMNNVAQRKQEITVVDSKAPEIALAGSDPTWVECSNTVETKDSPTTYTGAVDKCDDLLDSETLGDWLPVTTTTPAGNVFTSNQAGETWNSAIANEMRTLPDIPRTSRVLKYTCSDYAGNTAPLRTRTVTTVDTTEPTLILTENNVQTPGATRAVEYVAHTSKSQETDLSKYGIFAKDSCDSSVGSDDVKISWGPRAFNPAKLGDYVRTYSVSDASGNTATKTRTFTVVDTAIPVIHPVGYSSDTELLQTLEATRDKSYTDKGATCVDFVDGELSHAVEVSGEVVNMRIPGTYKIRYDCQDLSGNNAVERYRTVVVEDTTKPKISLVGTMVVYVESGFPYVDAGATATDSLDGDITDYIWTDGNVVNIDKALNSQKSCQQINDAYCKDNKCTSNKGTPNGQYKVIKDGKPQTVSCFFYTDNSVTKGFTYHVHHTKHGGNCKAWGMDTFTKKSNKNYQTILTHLKEVHPNLKNVGNLDQFICYQNDYNSLSQQQQGSDDRKYNVKGLHENKASAQVGKYVIQYHVQDKAGNNAIARKRTVIVKDTLPPVITLHLKNKLVTNVKPFPAVGIDHKRLGGFEEKQYPNTRKSWKPTASGTGISTENNVGYKSEKFLQRRNPAAYKEGDAKYGIYGKGFGNPNMALMAEAASTNGWMIGAIASAVAGVALLGYSSRKSATSVPV